MHMLWGGGGSGNQGRCSGAFALLAAVQGHRKVAVCGRGAPLLHAEVRPAQCTTDALRACGLTAVRSLPPPLAGAVAQVFGGAGRSTGRRTAHWPQAVGLLA